MKWHQRRCDGSEKPLEDAMYREFKGDEGGLAYSVYSHLTKVMARALDAELEAFRCGKVDIVRPIMTEDVDFFTTECRTTPERFLAVTAFLRKKGELTVRQLSADHSRITLEMPNILRDIDNYTRTAINKICEERRIPADQVLKVYVESTKTLRRVSSLSRADSSSRSEAKAEQGPDGGKPVETLPPAGGSSAAAAPGGAPGGLRAPASQGRAQAGRPAGLRTGSEAQGSDPGVRRPPRRLRSERGSLRLRRPGRLDRDPLRRPSVLEGHPMSKRPRRKSWQPRPPACRLCGDTGWAQASSGAGVVRCGHLGRRPGPSPEAAPAGLEPAPGLDRMRQASGEREPGEDLEEGQARG